MTRQTIELKHDLIAVQIHLAGRVQGVGMRPALARLAKEFGLRGHVRNSIDGVVAVVEGSTARIDSLLAQLSERIPAAAIINNVQVTSVPVLGLDTFEIEHSDPSEGSAATVVPPDTAVCEECSRDVLNPNNHRFKYPFTSCTNCGPRYSVVAAMPWDRADTTMSEFQLCTRCRGEDRSPADRRFHAQTNACPDCGPSVQFHNLKSGRIIAGRDVLTAAADVIRTGGILALKGLGGYQLVCDAVSTSAIDRLRQYKKRVSKPLAVMVASAADAERLGVLSDIARAALMSPANPIVLVDAAATGGLQLSNSVHPHLSQIGLILPTTPLHLLLLREVDGPCVVTSANVNSDPIQYQDEYLRSMQGRIADAVLAHDREILRPVDDSVVRVIAERAVAIRCGRGLAPLTVSVDSDQPVLAVGAHQKVAMALSNGRQAILGPHVGDLGSISARQRFLEQADQLCSLYRIQPAVIAHDLHPDLFTTRWAQEQPSRTIAVQHHHAHVASGMCENNWLDREVLGVAFDGTGFGTDGTIWGGEFLVCTAASFRRVARLRPMSLPGGEQAIHNPWRVALAMLHDAIGSKSAVRQLEWLGAACKRQVRALAHVLDRAASVQQDVNSQFLSTSSAGRLFDGLASLLMNIDHASYEGEPAIRLEAACVRSSSGQYRLDVVDGQLMELDWRPLVRDVVRDRMRGVPTGMIGMRIIRSVAAAIQKVCRRFAELPVVLTGGCFQNALLTERTHQLLQSEQRAVGMHQQIPPNDGGLSVGQLAVAAARIREESHQYRGEG